MLRESRFARGWRSAKFGWMRRTLWMVPVLLGSGVVACGDSGKDGVESEPEPKLSNAEIATKVLLEGVQAGDVAVIQQYVSEDYVQHGSLAPDGRSGLLAFAVLADKIQYEVHRTLEDGDYVALHSTYTFPDNTKSVVFDVFRLDSGLLVEHWDAVQALPEAEPGSHGMTDGVSDVTDLEATEQNRALVQGFVQVVMKGGDLTRVPEFVSSDQFIQHDPEVGDGIDAYRAYVVGLAEEGYIRSIGRSPIVVAEGNFVLVGSEGTTGAPNDQHYAIFYDLFRESAGRIVEHWDVIPALPDAATLPHQNGYF